MHRSVRGFSTTSRRSRPQIRPGRPRRRPSPPDRAFWTTPRAFSRRNPPARLPSPASRPTTHPCSSVTTTDASGATPTTRVPFVTYELFEHPTDGTVALAFTTLHALVAALGEAQPWIVTSLGPLAEGVGAQGVTVHLDPRTAPGHRNWHPADLSAYAREVR